jgi:hypothetical protein
MQLNFRRFFFLALIFLSSAALSAEGPSFGMVPESERGLKACVMGLDPQDGDYFGLPHFAPKVARAQGWDRQCFWLDYQLSHGELMQKMPAEAQLYVAFPVSAQIPTGGYEVDFFKAYLKQKAGWSKERIEKQVRFFSVDDPLIWAQDFALEEGLGPQGQRLLHIGPGDARVYRHFARSLSAQFPEAFTKKDLPLGVSGEGGDLSLARFPNGNVGLVIGRHRVLRYLQDLGKPLAAGQVVGADTIKEVETVYSLAYGVPVMVIPQKPLLEGWGTEELFHLDMVASFMGGTPSQVVVPQLVPGCLDHATQAPLDAVLAAALTREYDVVAEELSQAGFVVQRAPLADHPARSPTNSVKYSSQAGRRIVLLARYARADGGSALSVLHQALDQLNSASADVHEHPSADQIAGVNQAFAAVWKALAACDKDPDPSYQAQADAYTRTGFTVVPVPDYPWGAGSLHCQFLH